MKYAIVSTGGHQYKVAENDVVSLDLLASEPQKDYIFPQVLLYVEDGNRSIGKPILSDVVVRAKVIEHGKGKKVRVAKFKAKARYRRVVGFRSSITKVQIEEIGMKK